MLKAANKSLENEFTLIPFNKKISISFVLFVNKKQKTYAQELFLKRLHDFYPQLKELNI